METQYNPRLLPKGYFSRRALPYWCLAMLDSVTLLFAGLLSLYLVWGGQSIVDSFWPCVRVGLLSLPIFLLFMHVFRTYVGTLIDAPVKILARLACALVSGGVVLGGLLQLLPDELKDYTPGVRTIGVALVISLVLQWSYRMLAKVLFRYEGGKRKFVFTKADKRGSYEDTSIADRKRINLCLAHMSEEGVEQKYVKEAFDTNWVVPLGPNVNEFEHSLERFVSGKETGETDKKVVALSAGTAAIHLALRACGVTAGDEVIVQSFTFCASANPVTYVGAVPVFVDSEPDTWNMDPDLLEEAIKDRIRKTGTAPKAIIPVSLYGMPYNVDRIMEIANRYQIPVIEDAAEGLGSRWKGKVLGTFGRYGVLSFNGNKMITTSGGGALICNGSMAEGNKAAEETPAEAAKNIMWYATQAREAYPYYQHEAIGYNYRMSNVCAGIGRGQMTVVDDHIAHHKHVQQLYEELLQDVPGIHVHKAPAHRDDKDGCKVYDSNYWLCAITLEENLKVKGQEDAYKTVVGGAVGGAAGVTHQVDSAVTDCQPNANVEAMRVYLDNAQIEARPVWKPMHKQPVFRYAPAYVNGVSESVFFRGLCLPAGPCVSDDDIRFICQTIKEAVSGF